MPALQLLRNILADWRCLSEDITMKLPRRRQFLGVGSKRRYIAEHFAHRTGRSVRLIVPFPLAPGGNLGTEAAVNAAMNEAKTECRAAGPPRRKGRTKP